MSYETFRSTKRWTPLNAIPYRPRPNTTRLVGKQHSGRDGRVAARRRLVYENRIMEQLMDQLLANESDAINVHVDDSEQLAAKQEEFVENGSVPEVVTAEEDEEDCHYGIVMCMGF